MTTSQLVLMIGFYLAFFVAVAYFTRATVRRIAGALAGGAVFGLVALFGLVLGETQSWWSFPKAGTSHFYWLVWTGLAVSCSPDYLIVWRVVRRFGARGLAVCVLVSALIGPPRDYGIAAAFPEWMTFSSGIAPVIADGVIYIFLVVVGYAVMRMVAGPDQSDVLASRRR